MPRPSPRASDEPGPAAPGASYGIADLAREFDVTTRTIRFYEAEGLITPSRQGQRRIFSPRDRVRLRLILRGKRLGFSLGEIRERRATLERQRADIVEALDELAEVEARCAAQLKQLERRRTGRG